MSRDYSIYIILCVVFSVMLVMANLVGQKFVNLPLFFGGSIELSSGALFYPLTFLLTDLTAEFYGKTKANFCVILAIVMNIMAALIILVIDNLQATSWSNVDNIIFHKVFGPFSICFIGSVLA